jgi:hypothetical protein
MDLLLSIEGISKNLWLFLKTATVGLVGWLVDS